MKARIIPADLTRPVLYSKLYSSACSGRQESIHAIKELGNAKCGSTKPEPTILLLSSLRAYQRGVPSRERPYKLMGYGFDIECESCNYSDSFQIGVGMMYGRLENVIDCVPSSLRAKVLEILREHDVTCRDYGHKLYVCSHCNALSDQFYLRIEYDESETFEISFECRKCKAPLEEAPDNFDFEQWPCPRCGSRTLKTCDELMWD
jgi:DNA-directed RNA polymerase subunit RPC12/RpoP